MTCEALAEVGAVAAAGCWVAGAGWEAWVGLAAAGAAVGAAGPAGAGVGAGAHAASMPSPPAATPRRTKVRRPNVRLLRSGINASLPSRIAALYVPPNCVNTVNFLSDCAGYEPRAVIRQDVSDAPPRVTSDQAVDIYGSMVGPAAVTACAWPCPAAASHCCVWCGDCQIGRSSHRESSA